MKTLVKLSAVALVLAWASSAWAQVDNRNGRVVITGNTTAGLKLAFYTFTETGSTSGAIAAGAQGASNAFGQNDNLDFSFVLGDIGAGAVAPTLLRGGTIELALRSSSAAGYILQATVTTDIDPANTQANGELTLDDFGWGISAQPVCNGDKANCVETGHTLGQPIFDATAVSTADPFPIFGAGETLSQLTTTQTILNGGRITLRGQSNATNNALIVPTTYGIAPGMYAELATFTVTVAYTLSPAP